MIGDVFLTDTPRSQEAFRRLTETVREAIAETLTCAATKTPGLTAGGTLSAYSGLPPEELRALLKTDTLLPNHGLGIDAVLERMKNSILPNLVRTASPGYMAHLHSPVLLESLAAEMVISVFNQSMDSWDQSPAATEIEMQVVRELCTLFGYGDGADGVFTSGGSQSNTTALLLARDSCCRKKFTHDIKKHGLPDGYKKLKMYASEVSHFSMEKSAHLLGLGYNAVEKVPVDGRRKMDVGALEELIAKDTAAGRVPFCVAVTLGTTDYGSIDPIEETAALCQKHGIWLHADAAYGSGLILSQSYSQRIGGVHLCDSITVDFHKMFLQPISCSAVLVKNAEDFSPLELHADYLNREEDEEDGYINLVGKSMQTTRRFDALKIWLSFQARGKDGWDALISTCVENAAYVYAKLSESADFETIAPPEISSVVFRIRAPRTPPSATAARHPRCVGAEPAEDGETFTDEMNKSIRRALLHQKGIVIGQTMDEGRVFLKFTLLNPTVTKEYLDMLLSLILSMRDEYAGRN